MSLSERYIKGEIEKEWEGESDCKSKGEVEREWDNESEFEWESERYIKSER